jgi:uncharacterized RDD family membrane protein YckC
MLTLVVGVLALVVATLLDRGPDVVASQRLLLAVALGLVYLIWLGFDIYFELRQNGQTPGKRYAGIRVIRDGGAPLDFQAACVRNLLGMADYLPVFYVLGAILILLTPRRQRLGDLAAGTLVIRERALAAPDDLHKAVARWADPGHVFTAAQLAACSPNDRHLLRSYLLRQGHLDRDGRDSLALKLASTFQARTGYEPEFPLLSGDEATRFLASLYRDLEAQAARGY